jgi:nucleotide-binding universal stress UspA family protein
MKNIIVPIDFSEESLNGLRLAIHFANRFSSRIQMVYVQKYPSEMGRVGYEEEKKKALQNFESLKREYAPKMLKTEQLEYIVKKGKIFREVVNQAQAFEDSVIISSTHGASGFEDLFIGSNALKIISASDLPVITIRHGSVPREIRTIVLPIDSSNDTRQKLPLTAKIAAAFGSEVHVLGLTTTESEDIENKVSAYCKQVCEYLKDHDIKYKLERQKGSSVTTATINYALDVEADLISIMTEQNDSLADLVLGTSAQHMLNKSPVPVLSITPKEIFILGSFRTSGAPY